jgi:ATP-dependent Clp protease ATP-binding subunit ClpC
MFERYTERARRVIFFARYEAAQVGSTTIETEHLLLGLIREDKNLPGRFIRNMSSIESMRSEIEGRTTIREKISTSMDLQLSSECKRILAYAAEEAERLAHRNIGTEHLLLGILREEKCLAAEILQEWGLNLKTICEELARAVVDRQSAPDTATSTRPSKDALVPDAATAERIAKAIWTGAYGAEAVETQVAPQVRLLNRGSWQVNGGPLFAIIRSLDGTVLAMGRNIEGTHV